MSPSSRSLNPIFCHVAFFCIFVLLGVSHHSETHSTFFHDRRSNFLVHREDNFTSTTTITTTDIITTSTPPSSSTPSSSPFATSLQSSGLSSISSVSSGFHSSVSFPEHSSSSLSSSSSTKSIASSTSLASSSAQSSIVSTPSVLRLTFANTPTSTLSSVQSIATTLALTDYSDPTAVTSIIATTSTEPEPTNLSSALTSSSFWQKKGAVAATFTIIAFVLIAICAILVVTFLKKRNANQQRRLHEELFEKYSEDEHRSNSPDPSINAAPLDAFARRDVRYDNGVTYSGYPTAPIQHTAPSTSPVQHPDYYNQPPSRYLLPSQTQSARKPVPTSFREQMGRQRPRDSYQPSIDSFYGGASQPTA